ncbi:MAG TPA: hypothetical protein VNS22_01930 [Geminicoccus sp.]|uniref:hypothetical protein n=1 Tax=Geminicoccus sp. TaxID=2024832 RepID=UPI002BA5B49E|nr:hypothetical protein [Geminicoccus sp.]HWL67122.1 hypothetical protein [Geminicoccus sp.]
MEAQRRQAQQEYETARNAPVASGSSTLDKDAERQRQRVEELIQSLKDERAELLLLTDAQKKGSDAVKKAETDIKALQAIRKAKVADDSAEAATIRELVTGNAELSASYEATGEAAKAAQQKREQAAKERADQLKRQAQQEAALWQKPFENAIEGVQSQFTSTFESIFRGGVNSFSDLAGAVKDIFIRLAAEIATLMVIRPVMAPIMGAVGGAGIGAGTAGGFSSGIGSILQSGGSYLNSSALGGAINNFGSSYLGLAGGGVPGTTAGIASGGGFLGVGGNMPGATGIFGTTASLTSVLGAAGLGAFGGGTLAGLLGLNKTGGSIGGGAGAGLGALIGSAFPVVGTALGGILGGLGGSLFGGLFGGGKPSNKEQGINYSLTTGLAELYGQTGKKFSQENQDAAKTIAQAAADYAAALKEATGGTIGLQGFDVAVGSRDGFKLGLGSTQTQYGSVEELTSALMKAVTESLKGAGANVQQLVGSGKLDYGDAEGTQKALQLAAAIDRLVKPSSDAQTAVEELNAQFAEAIAQAKALGLSTKELSAEQVRQVGLLRDQVQAQIDAFVGTADSGAQMRIEIEAIRAKFAELSEAGRQVGADVSKLGQAQAEQINAVQNAYAAQARAEADARKAQEKSVRDQIQAYIGNTNAATQMQAQVQAVRDRFTELSAAAKALGIDTGALTRAQIAQSAAIQQAARAAVTSAAQDFISRGDPAAELAREKQRIRDEATALARDVIAMGGTSDEIMKAQKKQVDALEKSYADQKAAVAQSARDQAAAEAERKRSAAQAARDRAAAEAEARRQQRASTQQSLSAFLAAGDPAKELAYQIAQIREQAAELTAAAREYGLSTSGITAAMNRQISAAKEAAAEMKRQEAEARANEKRSIQQQVASALAFGNSAKELEVEITQIRMNFQDLTKQAREYGISTSGLSAAMDRQIAAARKAAAEAKAAEIEQAKTGIAAFLAAGNPLAELQIQIDDVSRTYRELSKQAKELGLSERGLAAARDQQQQALRDAFARQQRDTADAVAAFVAGADPLKQMQVSITGIWRQYEDLALQARQMGVSEKGLAEARDEAIKAIRRQVEAQKQDLRDQIAAFVAGDDPAKQLQVQITGIWRQFESLSEQAKALGVSEAGLAKARDDAIEATRRQAFETAKAAYQSAGDEARSMFGSLMDPLKGLLASFDLARPGGLGRSFRANENEVERLYAQAMAGDVDAIKALPSLISTTRDQINQLAASSPKTQQTEARLEQITKDVLALVQAQAKEAEDAGPAAVVTKLSEVVATLKTKFDELRRQMEASQQALMTTMRAGQRA